MRWSFLLLSASFAAAGASTTPEAAAVTLSSPSPPPPAEPTQLADDAVKSVEGAAEGLDSVQKAVVATSSSLTGADEAGPTATSSTSSAVSQPSTSLDDAGEQSKPPETPGATSSSVPDSAHSQPSSDLPTSSPLPPSSSHISSEPADTPSPSPSPSPVASPDDAIPAVEHLPLTEVPPVPELLSFNEWRERYVVLPDPSLARRAKKTAQRTRQDAVGAGVAGARAAEYDGDGADLGSLFVKSDESGSSNGAPRAGDTAGDSTALARRSGRIEATEVPTSDESPSTQTSSPIQPLPNVGSGEPSDPLLHLKDRSNYAAFECAAMVHRSSRKSKGASAILVEKKDRYMLTPCSATPKFVDVELCDEIQIDTLVLANFEFFSSTFKHFKASCSVDYPGKPADWHDLGTFRARNVRGVQVFPVRNPHFCRYLRVDFLSHFGSEHYCPVSLLRVYGFTQLDAYRESERRKAKAIEEALAAADLIDEEQELQDRLDDALRVEVENLERIEPAAGGKNTTEAEEPAAPSPSPPSDAATEDDVAGRPRGPDPVTTASPGSASPGMATTLSADPLSAPTDPSSTNSSYPTRPPMSATSSPSASESQAAATDTTETEMPSEPPSRSAPSPTAVASERLPPSSSSTLQPSASPTSPSAQNVPTAANDLTRETPSPPVPASASSSPTLPSPGESPSSSSHSVFSSHTPSPSAAASSPTQLVTSAAPSSSPSAAAASNSTSSIMSSSHSTVPVVSPSPSAVRHVPRNESHHYQHLPQARPPPVIPPPLHQQPQPGESIYGTIMKRLTSLEHNQTLSMHFIEAQSSMLREAFGRVEKRLNDIEGSRTRQEQSIRQALLDLESQRVELERERLDLAMQVTLLSEDVRLERRLTIVQLIALFLLFVFVGFTRGIPTSPFIHLASSHLERPPLPRKESKKQEEKPRMEREKEPEKKVDEDELSGSEALRRGHRRALSTSHRQSGTSKRHTSLSKSGPRRHYGVGAPPSSSKPLSAIRNSRPFTPPMRHSSAPPEEPFPSAAALEAKEAARRRIFPQSARKPSPSQGYEFPRPSSAGKLGRTSGPISLEGDLRGFEASSSSLQANSRDRLMPFPSSHLAVGRSVLNPSTADEADTEPSDSPAPQILLAGFAADDEGEEDADDVRVGLASPVSSSSNGTGFGAYGRAPMHDDGDERDYHTYSSADDDEVHPFSTIRPRSPPPRSSSPRTVSSAAAMRAYGRNGRPPRPHVRVRPATSQGIASPVGENEKGKRREVDQFVQKEGGGEPSPEASGLAIPVPEPSSTLPWPPPEPLIVKQEEEEGGA